MSGTTSLFVSATSLEVLKNKIVGHRIRRVFESENPIRHCVEEWINPEEEWVYFNRYIELENGVLFYLEEFTIQILESLPEPTVNAEVCATQLLDGSFRDIRVLNRAETSDRLKGRQITHLIAREDDDIELRPIFLVLDNSCHLYVKNEHYGNSLQFDELDLQIDVLADEEHYTTIPECVKCDSLGRLISSPPP